MAEVRAKLTAKEKTAADREEIDQSRMPLLDHLVELRKRLTWSMIAFLIAFLISFYFANPIFDFLVQPLQDLNLWEDQEGKGLIFTALHEKFFTNVKVAFFFAASFRFPWCPPRFGCSWRPGSIKQKSPHSCRS